MIWTVTYHTNQLPDGISRTEPNGHKHHYDLRMKGGGAYPVILEYYETSHISDEEEIAFQGFGHTEQEAIDDMLNKLRSVGLNYPCDK